MDFIDVLCDRINETPNLPVLCVLGYLGDDESLVVYPLPGSRVIQEFMDGMTVQAINCEIAMKSKSHKNISVAMWNIQNLLENTTEMPSVDGSYEFESMAITNKPFISRTDDQGWYEFILDITAQITVYRKGE